MNDDVALPIDPTAPLPIDQAGYWHDVENDLLASVMRKVIAAPDGYAVAVLETPDRATLAVHSPDVGLTPEEAELVQRLWAEVGR